MEGKDEAKTQNKMQILGNEREGILAEFYHSLVHVSK
jgi:hypothetical protein